MKFQLRLHSQRKGVQVLEIVGDSGELLATLIPGDTPREVRFLSKHLFDPDAQIISSPTPDGVLPGMVRFLL